jgi:hypothetical protein
VEVAAKLFSIPEADRTWVLTTDVTFLNTLENLVEGVINVEQVTPSEARLIFTILGVPKAILDEATDEEVREVFELLIKA